MSTGSDDNYMTHITSRLSSNGTISSTSVFGALPSAVTPVAQFYEESPCQGPELQSIRQFQRRTCSTVANAGSLSRSKIAIHSWAMFKCNENWKMPNQVNGNASTAERRTDLLPLFLVLWQVSQHVFHVVQVHRPLSTDECN